MDIDVTTYLHTRMTDQEIINSIFSAPECPFPWDPVWLCFDQNLLDFEYCGPSELPVDLALTLILSRRQVAPDTEVRIRRALSLPHEQRAKSMTQDVIARVCDIIEHCESDCIICMEKTSHMLVTTKCGHIVCAACFEQFVLTTDPNHMLRCPMCRLNMTVVDVVDMRMFIKVHKQGVQAGNDASGKSLLD